MLVPKPPAMFCPFFYGLDRVVIFASKEKTDKSTKRKHFCSDKWQERSIKKTQEANPFFFFVENSHASFETLFINKSFFEQKRERKNKFNSLTNSLLNLHLSLLFSFFLFYLQTCSLYGYIHYDFHRFFVYFFPPSVPLSLKVIQTNRYNHKHYKESSSYEWRNTHISYEGFIPTTCSGS